MRIITRVMLSPLGAASTMGVLTAALNVTYYSDNSCTNVLNSSVNPQCTSGPGAQVPNGWIIECDDDDSKECTGFAFFANSTPCPDNLLPFVPYSLLQCPCAAPDSTDNSKQCYSKETLLNNDTYVNQTTLSWKTGKVSDQSSISPLINGSLPL